MNCEKSKYGWMIYNEGKGPNSFGFDTFTWMKEAAAKYDIELDVITIDKISLFMSSGESVLYFDGKKMRKPDFAVVRAYNYELGYFLESIDIPVINSTESMYISRNKILTAELLNKYNIPTPKIVYKNYNYDIIVKLLGEKFVLKAVTGSKGENIFLVENRNMFSKIIDYFLLNEIDFFAQEFIETSYGKDIRVYTLGDEVLGGVIRYSDDDFRSNYSLGGNYKYFELNEEIINLSKKIVKVTNLEFSGLDILFTQNGYTVCEINGNAGYQTISSVSDIDMADKLYQYISNRIYKNA